MQTALDIHPAVIAAIKRGAEPAREMPQPVPGLEPGERALIDFLRAAPR